MRLRDALKLHNEDEVTIKRTGQVLQVVDIEIVPRGAPISMIHCVSVLLEDGNWYGHQEIR